MYVEGMMDVVDDSSEQPGQGFRGEGASRNPYSLTSGHSCSEPRVAANVANMLKVSKYL